MDRFGDRRGGGGGGGRGGFSRQAAVKALKESVQTGHKTGLPGNLLKLFESRQAPSPIAELKKRPPRVPYSGVAQYVAEFAAPGDEEYKQPPEDVGRRLYRNPELNSQARIEVESREEKRIRLAKWQVEEAERTAREAAKDYDPNKDPKIESDPFKTLIVARLSFDVTEKKLRREFEEFGPIKRIRVVYDKQGKHRGYAFIEYEHKKDMKEAYKLGDGKKIEGRRVLVDVERGRTVEHWRPRRLGGGLGGASREPKPKKGQQALAGILPSAAPVGGPYAYGGAAAADDRYGDR